MPIGRILEWWAHRWENRSSQWLARRTDAWIWSKILPVVHGPLVLECRRTETELVMMSLLVWARPSSPGRWISQDRERLRRRRDAESDGRETITPMRWVERRRFERLRPAPDPISIWHIRIDLRWNVLRWRTRRTRISQLLTHGIVNVEKNDNVNQHKWQIVQQRFLREINMKNFIVLLLVVQRK